MRLTNENHRANALDAVRPTYRARHKEQETFKIVSFRASERAVGHSEPRNAEDASIGPNWRAFNLTDETGGQRNFKQIKKRCFKQTAPRNVFSAVLAGLHLGRLLAAEI